MIMPNKLIPFKDSILSKLTYILDVLVHEDENLENLYQKVKCNFEDVNQYILTLDVLFALERIEFDERMKVLKYVKADNLR
ncbi:ABC-three component system middle component 7 [Desnuesiella massiliensis]|uniref:ABC-three component system middle component 7 n=1 Tax=Desnuesiella massiliensis TaxID=1650662 RepID=UPI0006E1B5DA|nr:ABC-three component system middle component 7 [Desnuesiella massiliensis]